MCNKCVEEGTKTGARIVAGSQHESRNADSQEEQALEVEQLEQMCEEVIGRDLGKPAE